MAGDLLQVFSDCICSPKEPLQPIYPVHTKVGDLGTELHTVETPYLPQNRVYVVWGGGGVKTIHIYTHSNQTI